MKSCRNCFEEKEENLFVKNKAYSSGIDTICLKCSRQRVKQWRKENPEKRKLQSQKESKKDYCHNKHLQNTYGITFSEYMEMFNEQMGKCLICKRHQIDFKKRLFVDHCHTTGKIRGLLCQQCNMCLGGARDKIEVLLSAIKYLEQNGK